MPFLEGHPEEPKCGFSRTTVAILGDLKADYGTFDILTDDEVGQIGHIGLISHIGLIGLIGLISQFGNNGPIDHIGYVGLISHFGLIGIFW